MKRDDDMLGGVGMKRRSLRLRSVHGRCRARCVDDVDIWAGRRRRSCGRAARVVGRDGDSHGARWGALHRFSSFCWILLLDFIPFIFPPIPFLNLYLSVDMVHTLSGVHDYLFIRFLIFDRALEEANGRRCIRPARHGAGMARVRWFFL